MELKSNENRTLNENFERVSGNLRTKTEECGRIAGTLTERDRTVATLEQRLQERVTFPDVVSRLATLGDVMNAVDHNADANMLRNTVDEHTRWIVNRLVPTKSPVRESDWGKFKVGVFTAVSKAHQYERESRMPRNNTTLVYGPMAKRSRRDQF